MKRHNLDKYWSLTHPSSESEVSNGELSPSQQANVGKVKNRMASKMMGGNKKYTGRKGEYSKTKQGNFMKIHPLDRY